MKQNLLLLLGIVLLQSGKILLILMLYSILHDDPQRALTYVIGMVLAIALGMKTISYSLKSTANENPIHHHNTTGQGAYEAGSAPGL